MERDKCTYCKGRGRIKAMTGLPHYDELYRATLSILIPSFRKCQNCEGSGESPLAPEGYVWDGESGDLREL